MPVNVEQYKNIISLTYQREDSLFVTSITDHKCKITVKGIGKTKLESYGNAIKKLNVEK